MLKLPSIKPHSWGAAHGTYGPLPVGLMLPLSLSVVSMKVWGPMGPDVVQ